MQPVDADLDIPETDFSAAVQPHRYAMLRGDYRFAVFLDRELWEHFGSQEEIVAALRALVDASTHIRKTG